MTRENVGTVEDLHESATRFTGLDDFGTDDYREGLAVLLESYERDARLTPFGHRVKRAFLRGALIARLLSEASWKQHPEHADVPIERPVFVTGLPRTGTTALHRLLTADPAHQGLEVWLTEVPQPRPPRSTWPENPVFQRIQAGYEQHHVEHPEFLGAHESSADQVEECWQLLRQSAKSVSYECLAHLPMYSVWLSRQDWTDAYTRHRRNLQLIGLPDKDRRWVLKNPSHLFALDALLAVYPDALVIQTHRAPRTIIASVCSLNEQAAGEWSTAFRGATVGQDQLELWARGAETFLDARPRHDASQFYDVYYEDFVGDPLATVEAIYQHFGLPLSDEARSAMSALHRGSASRPGHRYVLEDFGLTADQVDDRFSRYLEAHSRAT
ncbi:sulfotransferase [Amycolatopsis acidiphila]|uniref:Sulfotransferase n=1 Tax=Amycolatopsis acidiphila TaxID=715473 RepID=A0A557ZS29_9PSEU|nr:sulfotransferase [Amycolatopsis acidiphila]TVT14830.1 sulfotransferase [Amycolatopsis acidiphila]UIJ62072.1 sulfotransferase [Amycolatopsis acidiphila]GHG91729.1 sulfotransferase [Amycolatopsis acidiphila]